MKSLALALLFGLTIHAFAQGADADEDGDPNTPPAAATAPGAPGAAKPTPKEELKPLDPEMVRKAQKFCVLVEGCNRAHPGKAAQCVKTSIKDSGLMSHNLEGDQAKDLPRFLRREGFVDAELTLKKFSQLPDGAILVLDAHDPIKDHKPLCPRVYGNVVVKCGDKWVDDQKYDLDFHMKRGCRTKGIWLHPGLIQKSAKD